MYRICTLCRSIWTNVLCVHQCDLYVMERVDKEIRGKIISLPSTPPPFHLPFTSLPPHSTPPPSTFHLSLPHHLPSTSLPPPFHPILLHLPPFSSFHLCFLFFLHNVTTDTQNGICTSLLFEILLNLHYMQSNNIYYTTT